MKPIKETRRLNLVWILKNEFDNQADLATALGVQPNVVSRAINLDSKDRRNIGDTFARSIERKTNKPEGWMDVMQEPYEVNDEAALYATQYSGSRDEPLTDLEFNAVEFALQGLESIRADPDFAKFLGSEWLARAFIVLYKAYSDEKMREVGAKAILRLVA